MNAAMPDLSVGSVASAPSGLAARYTAALLGYADGSEPLEADLTRLMETLKSQPQLVAMLGSPLVSRAGQEQVMQTFLKDNQFCQSVERLALLLVRNRRADVIVAVVRETLAELARRRGEITADVISATPLSDAQRDRLAEILTRAVGRKPRINVVEDPSLLAGFVVHVGSRMFDGSLQGRLKRLHLALAVSG